MPDTTTDTLYATATLIDRDGLHTGDQLATRDPRTGIVRLDICAAAYMAAEQPVEVPPEFYADETAALRLIESSAGAMQAIRAISDHLHSEPCTTPIAPGVEVPDYIEHVSNWAATRGIGQDQPPTELEVLGVIVRTADALTAARAHHHRAA